MLDLQSFNRALKAKWVQRYLDPHNRGKWKLFVEFSVTGHDLNLLLQENLNSDDVASLPIWYNSLLRIDNKPMHYRPRQVFTSYVTF